MKALECSQDYSHYQSMGIFQDAQGQLPLIWSNFVLVRDFIVVLITCKKEEDPIKNEGARVATRYVDFFGAQGQITPKAVVGSGRNSISYKF